MNNTAVVAALAAALAVILWLIAWRLRKRDDFPYELHEGLMTRAEQKFYHVLKEAVPSSTSVFSKPRIADVLRVESLGSDTTRWQRAFNRINAKHLDFVICDSEDSSFLCAIELNDSSHQLPQRQQRDQFVAAACDAAGLPLLFVPVAQRYELRQLEKQIAQLIG